MKFDRDSFCIGILVGVAICFFCVYFAIAIDETCSANPITENVIDKVDYAETVQSVDNEDNQIALIEGISDEERELVSRVVAAEARGESYRGIMAVCQCIKDRGDSWNMTYTEVVLQEGQFADPYEGTVSDLVKLAVHECFDLGFRVSESPIYHFYAHEKCLPNWASEKVLVFVEGGHTFMY